MAARPLHEVTADRERRAWELRKQCWTQKQIADELGMAQSSVSDALQRVEKRLYEEFSTSAHVLKARQTEQLDHIAAEALLAWEQSKLDAESTEVTEEETEIGDEGNKFPATNRKTKKVTKGQTGNPALLAQAIAALAAQRSIWGAEAPKKTDVTSGGQRVPIQVIEVVRAEPRAIDGPSE